MWWLVIPVVAWTLLDILAPKEEDDQLPASRLKKSILESNLNRLKREVDKHKGPKIAILGQPGAGKSSLLQGITGGQARPAPVIGIETDATTWAVDSRCSLLSFFEESAFSDVPGYDTASHPIELFLSLFPFTRFDACILVIGGKLHSSDEAIYQCISTHNIRVCIARSFSESIEKDERDRIKKDITRRLKLPNGIDILFFSNRTCEGIDDICSAVHLRNNRS